MGSTMRVCRHFDEDGQKTKQYGLTAELVAKVMQEFVVKNRGNVNPRRRDADV